MSGKTAAAIVGFSEWRPKRVWHESMFALDAMAQLAAETLEDAGFDKDEVDGIAITHIADSRYFATSAVAEHLGLKTHFNEFVDLGGATACGLIWRAAAAIEVGACSAVLILMPAVPAPPRPADLGLPEEQQDHQKYMGDDWGSPPALFEIPAGLVSAVANYAMVAQRYRAIHGLREETLAKLAVQFRDNAQVNPNAVFFGKPISIDDVMQSRRLVDPLKLLDAVMPCYGGCALLVTSAERAARGPHRAVRISGYGERLTHKSITAMPDLINSPLRLASQRAFAMAGTTPLAIDLTSIYDSFTITAFISLEQAGFCGSGEATDFVEQRDLRWNGDFPLNTHGGMLSFGQAHVSGGLSHVVEIVRQMRGDAGGRQLPRCNLGYCNGGGGIMSEEVALILEGA